MKGITIGQYYPGKSLIHKMDPRIKIVLTMTFILLIFFCKNFWALGLMGGFLFVGMLISGVPFKLLIKSLRAVLFIVLITAVINLFYVTDGAPLLPGTFIKVTDKGLLTAAFMAIRIASLIIGSSLMTFTTTPTMLTDAIERLLSPLKIFKIQVHTLAMMMTLALRFIPTLMEEIEKIMNAQKARGADLESGNIAQRAKALVPILVPLFVSSFRRAYELAFAMECRCYTGGNNRTRMKQMKFSWLDVLFSLAMAAIVAGVILLNCYFTHLI